MRRFFPPLSTLAKGKIDLTLTQSKVFPLEILAAFAATECPSADIALLPLTLQSLVDRMREARYSPRNALTCCPDTAELVFHRNASLGWKLDIAAMELAAEFSPEDTFAWACTRGPVTSKVLKLAMLHGPKRLAVAVKKAHYVTADVVEFAISTKRFWLAKTAFELYGGIVTRPIYEAAIVSTNEKIRAWMRELKPDGMDFALWGGAPAAGLF